jgi:hypothetical protein
MRPSFFRFRSVVLSALAWLLLAGAAAAAEVTLAWDANTEPDIAGYIVEYGPAAAPFTSSADVGNVTTWTLTGALPGTRYSFRVVAYNTNGDRSVPSEVVTGDTTTPGGPTLTPDRAALGFATVSGGAHPTTASQTIRLMQAGAGAITWTAISGAPWLQVTPATGSGSGSITLTVIPSAVPASATWTTISIAASGTSNVIDPIPVSLNVVSPGASQAPFGAMDTPSDNATGITGPMAITGWAIDDVGVTRVRIYRDPVAGENPSQLVFIGDATQVEDARPDVAATFGNYPASYRAGWGYLALTNMLPNQGNGTFRLSAYAEDADGHSTLIGRRTITCDNASATQPFGAIDTPAPGETVSGTSYASYGWVLARAPRRADVPGGGTVTVLIDGLPVGSPMGWAARPDLVWLFPAAQYPGVTAALALFAFDTTALSNGMHTMAWIVTDDQGNASGIGSRYFRVFNGAGSVAAAPSVAAAAASARGRSVEEEVASASRDSAEVQGRRGFALDTPFRPYPVEAGRAVVHAEELDRIELKTNGATEGYLWSGTDLRPLPAGSRLDRSGSFTWQPGPGFVGSYDLAFVRRSRGRLLRQDVRIVLHPKGSNRVGPQLIVDHVTPFVAGWAADFDSAAGTGIGAIHAWAYPVTPTGHGDPIFVDAAIYGGARPDVAAAFGDRFLNSGYGVFVKNLPPGMYDLALFPWSVAKGDFLPATLTRIVVR